MTTGGEQATQSCDGILPRAGISVERRKSAVLSVGVVPPKKQLYTHTKNLRGWKSNSADDYFKYLDSRYNFSGQVRPSVELLKAQLARVQSAQKLTILREHVVARFVRFFQSVRITQKALKDADRNVRLSVRKMLHLN
ncbi:hypothetical protein QE152_g22801 [Popillia japonica]|uniref:Uncharacterized protein n=1 Tax=Popillia japonica TaxID=7064 RepID=A0AAW1KKR5_POPJA